MNLRIASKQVACHSSQLQSSYAEISRFIRMRRHGITPTTTLCIRNRVRCFGSSNIVRSHIEPDEKLRKCLDDFKNSIRPIPWSLATSITGELNQAPVGQEVELTGYLTTRRDVSKKLSFALLRSKQQTWCIQIVSTPQSQTEEQDALSTHTALRSLRDWTPVTIRGTIKERQPAKDDNVFGMKLVNDREVALKSITPLNELAADVIIKADTTFPPEQRHLQLRTSPELRQNLLIRDRANRQARLWLGEHDWTELETPILFKSTPEGAREFLVPTRNKGLAYALPQSPQQYKQILMASGFTKYFQFARCFRDEDLRADRQPEFTQLDMEMAFAGDEDVMTEIEGLLRDIWYKILKVQIPEKFDRMTYQQAMASYGSDKPDLRFESKIHDITSALPADLISKITSLKDPTVEAIRLRVSDESQVTRKFISSFLDSPEGRPFLENPDGQPAVFVSDPAQPMQGLGPLGYQFLMDPPEGAAVENDELLILQARKNEPFSGGSTPLGNLRLALHKAAMAQGLVVSPEERQFKFVWIHDFPLFSPSSESEPGQGGSAGLSSTHHPFTAPKTPEDVELLLTSPERVVAAHYDIVVNGVELGGGSRRIHNAEIQEFIFKDVLKMKSERIEDFRHLLDVLKSGCPPHAGIALGWDRLMAVMLGRESVRDVIAFPKSGKGEDLLVKSPNGLTEGQLDTYHLQLKD